MAGHGPGKLAVSLRLDLLQVGKWLLTFSALVQALGLFRELFVALYGTQTALQDLRHFGAPAGDAAPLTDHMFAAARPAR